VVRLWVESRCQIARVGLVLIASTLPAALNGHQDAAATCTAVGVVLALLRCVPGGHGGRDAAPPGVDGRR
jgi:hypothetical protein